MKNNTVKYLTLAVVSCSWLLFSCNSHTDNRAIKQQKDTSRTNQPDSAYHKEVKSGLKKGNPGVVKGADTIIMLDTTISSSNYKMVYSQHEYEKQSPSAFKVIFSIKRKGSTIYDTLSAQSAGDTARLQPIILVNENNARKVKFYCQGDLTMFQMDLTWAQPLKGLYICKIEGRKIKMLTSKDGDDVSILTENNFIVNESNLKIMALEYYHASASYNARVFEVQNDKKLRHLKDLMLPEKVYQDDSILNKPSQQIAMSRKYLQ